MAKKKDFDICVSFFFWGGDRKSMYKLFFPVCELDNFGDDKKYENQDFGDSPVTGFLKQQYLPTQNRSKQKTNDLHQLDD